MTSFVSSSPQLYGVGNNTYDSDWVHGLEAENVQSLSGDQIVGLSTITVAPNIFYYGNNYCNLVTEGNVCKISLQYDLNCSVNSNIWYWGSFPPSSPPELRSSNEPNLFPVAIGEPLLKCRIIVINTGQDINSNGQTNFYGRLLKDGTIALVENYLLYERLTPPPLFTTALTPITFGDFYSLRSYWNANQAVGISICIEDSFLVE